MLVDGAASAAPELGSALLDCSALGTGEPGVASWPSCFLRARKVGGLRHLREEHGVWVVGYRDPDHPRGAREAVFQGARGYTIGSALLFPKTAPPGRMTINKARGMHPRIADRFDLTLECIRRHYRGEDSPLAGTLSEHAGFFALFEDFFGYVDFWLLQDLVQDGEVRFWLPFDDFQGRAVPQDVESYLVYSRGREDFITARNARIDDYARQQSSVD